MLHKDMKRENGRKTLSSVVKNNRLHQYEQKNYREETAAKNIEQPEEEKRKTDVMI